MDWNVIWFYEGNFCKDINIKVFYYKFFKEKGVWILEEMLGNFFYNSLRWVIVGLVGGLVCGGGGFI